MIKDLQKISVVSIARRDSEFEHLRVALQNQTFKNFELVTSTKGSIPEAWNDAISKAKGELIVFTESDALPLSETWLEEIANNAENGVILKGLEIKPTDLDLCNLVCEASLLKQQKFDTDFHVAEDVELFARLRKMGAEIRFVNAFPVMHSPSQTWKKTCSRGITIGMNFTKIIYLYGRNNIDDVNTRNIKANKINPISNRLRIITENVLILLGLFLGSIRYLPVLFKRKIRR
jgi:glycosyltransferase involved in cell wall biosynthesis